MSVMASDVAWSNPSSRRRLGFGGVGTGSQRRRNSIESFLEVGTRSRDRGVPAGQKTWLRYRPFQLLHADLWQAGGKPRSKLPWASKYKVSRLLLPGACCQPISTRMVLSWFGRNARQQASRCRPKWRQWRLACHNLPS